MYRKPESYGVGIQVSWFEDTQCNGCPLVDLRRRTRWGRSAMGVLWEAVQRIEFDLIKTNTMQGQFVQLFRREDC